MKEHVCHESQGCECEVLADEPKEECPVHGSGHWPPRCEVCGRLLPWSVRDRARALEDKP